MLAESIGVVPIARFFRDSRGVESSSGVAAGHEVEATASDTLAHANNTHNQAATISSGQRGASHVRFRWSSPQDDQWIDANDKLANAGDGAVMLADPRSRTIRTIIENAALYIHAH